MIRSSSGNPLGRAMPSRHYSNSALNTDPGVYEPGDPYKSNFSNYPDQDDFLNQLRHHVDMAYPKETMETVDEAEAEELDPEANIIADCGPPPADETDPSNPPSDLPLANDYQGIGGPETVPMFTPEAFHRPEVTPHKSCILDELYLAPTPNQLRAYQKILTKNEISQTKSRLQWSMLVHLTLTLVMIGKLLPEILDKIDVFVLEVEELFLPKPLLWEWIWLMSCPITYMGWSSSKKSNPSLMNKFITLLFLLGTTPIFFAMAYYASDLYLFISSGRKENLREWMGYPVCALWYVFFFLALQTHFFELYFAGQLIKTWMPKKKT